MSNQGEIAQGTEQMKIPLQEKIAELEQRIVRLEEQNRWLCRSREASVTGKRAFGQHWRKMWEEFHLAMKEMFE